MDHAGPVYILDEIHARPGRVRDCDALYRTVYFPLAARRAMTLHHAWLSPPFEQPEHPSTLFYVWSVADVPAWWRMRYGAFDPNVTDFWERMRSLVLTRRRLFLGPTPASPQGNTHEQ